MPGTAEPLGVSPPEAVDLLLIQSTVNRINWQALRRGAGGEVVSRSDS
jgi:hypothetical protein